MKAHEGFLNFMYMYAEVNLSILQQERWKKKVGDKALGNRWS